MNRSDAIILINRESGFGPYEVTGIGLLEATNLAAAMRWNAATGGKSNFQERSTGGIYPVTHRRALRGGQAIYGAGDPD
jgi:hypothetical protein